jgi:hypothetical protein
MSIELQLVREPALVLSRVQCIIMADAWDGSSLMIHTCQCSFAACSVNCSRIHPAVKFEVRTKHWVWTITVRLAGLWIANASCCDGVKLFFSWHCWNHVARLPQSSTPDVGESQTLGTQAVLEKVEADLLAACSGASSDVRPCLEAALQAPLELIRASGGMDDANSGPNPLSDALSVLKLAPGTPAETEESTDRNRSPSDSVSVSSLRSNNTIPAAPPLEAATSPSTQIATPEPLNGLTVEQIESLGDLADFQVRVLLQAKSRWLARCGTT